MLLDTLKYLKYVPRKVLFVIYFVCKFFFQLKERTEKELLSKLPNMIIK